MPARSRGTPTGGNAATSNPLAPGNYVVLVTDSNGCADTAQVAITEPDILVLTPGSINASCGVSDGVGIVSVTGGTQPYDYVWYDASFNVLDTAVCNCNYNDTVSGIPAGTYYVVVTDANLCQDFATVIVEETCETQLNLNALIEGYYLGGGLMQPVMYNAIEIALGGSYPNTTDCDTITVELHDQLSPGIVVPDGVSQAMLHIDGTALVTFPGTIQGGSYWIVVKNRTMVETWSSQPVTFGPTTSYNFTVMDTMAYGNNMREIEPGYWVMYSGDIDDGSLTPFQDGFVDAFDFLIMDVDIQAGNSGYYVTDINGDGFVDAFDFLVLDPNIQIGISKLTPP